ncbi:MAG TPA: non-homologous end-joining DNA ligase [Acidimicrobiales bacterium]|nr:non-homologous end-joining DNA ligase [Acidimicrobiales bacterium]
MKATTADVLPADDERWSYELKWDGARTLSYVEGGEVRLQSRSLRDVTGQYPELTGDAPWLPAQALFDGEVVAYRADGRPSFELLQQRMNVGRPTPALIGRVGVCYVVFDVLHLDGRSTMALPYQERRALLEGLGLDVDRWQVPRAHRGDGAGLLQATRDRGLEGLVAKRLDSAYEPGRRTRSWLKVKNFRRQEFVVGGWLPGEGTRQGQIGALLVGYHDPEGLRYAGRVGSGFTDAELTRLRKLLQALVRPTSPFLAPLPPEVARLGRFVEPDLVAEVAFSEWTAGGTLRQPSYKGTRDDVEPAAVVREDLPGQPPA